MSERSLRFSCRENGMNRLYWYLSGYWMLEITGASPEWVLNGLTEKRIPFWSLNWLDEFTVQLCVFRRDLDAVENTVQRA